MESIFTSFLNALKTALAWFIDLVKSIGDTAVGWIMSIIPSTSTDPNSSIGFAIDAANAWAPISEILGTLAIASTFVISFLVIKILLKLIP
jgi:hypothetical protein